MMNTKEKKIMFYGATLPYILSTIAWIFLIIILLSINKKYEGICIGLAIAWGLRTLYFLVFISPFNINNILYNDNNHL